MKPRLLLFLCLSTALAGCFVPIPAKIVSRAPSEVQAAMLPLGYSYRLPPRNLAQPMRQVSAYGAAGPAMRQVVQPVSYGGGGGWPAGANCAPPAGAQALAAEVLTLVNAQRRAAGLGMLFPDPALQATAHHHACDLAAHAMKGHVGSDGSHLQQRMAREGYAARVGAENAGHGYEGSPARLVAGWMGSPGHRRNLLDPALTEAGVGLAQGGPDGRMKWVMVYGQPY